MGHNLQFAQTFLHAQEIVYIFPVKRMKNLKKYIVPTMNNFAGFCKSR